MLWCSASVAIIESCAESAVIQLKEMPTTTLISTDAGYAVYCTPVLHNAHLFLSTAFALLMALLYTVNTIEHFLYSFHIKRLNGQKPFNSTVAGMCCGKVSDLQVPL